MLERLFELALIEQRDADIAVRAGIVRIELERAAAGGDRLVDASGEPAHFAEIGVIERDVGGDRDGAAHMLDRFGELAGLMRDDAEHVHGFGVVRSRRDGGAGQLVGVGQKAVPALLLRRECSAWPGGTVSARGRRRNRARGFGRDDGRGLRGAALAFGLERHQARPVALHDGASAHPPCAR